MQNVSENWQSVDFAVDTTKPYGQPLPPFVGVDNKASATKALTLGVIGSLVSWVLPPVGFALGILAIVYGKKGLRSTKSSGTKGRFMSQSLLSQR
jgi:hypothetical protein